MVVINWQIHWKEIPQRIKGYILWKCAQASLTARSLTYNEHLCQSYVIDILLEPLFWFVDNFAHCLGKVFVLCVTLLTSAVVIVAYWVGLPYWWEINPYIATFLVIFGNWILLNIVFHYYMGVVTPPGYPPHGSIISEAASICKKCISPKPRRTHHCSVCDKCILAMDHHCPWLNNCVGYFNARYFYLYMVYMLAGVSFIIVAGIDLGYQVLWVNDSGGILSSGDPEPDLIGHPMKMDKSGTMVPGQVIAEYDSINFPREHILPIPQITETQRICAHPWKRKAVIFMAVTCLSVLFALGTLSIMHGKHISNGETSVEAHINAKLRKKGPFKNPYNFGTRKNWYLFLGITQGRTFVKHVLLPSRHAPIGNGLCWHTIHDSMENWP